MVGGRARLSLVEYGAPVDLSTAITTATGFDRSRATQILLDAGMRVAGSLGFSLNPISIEARGARAIGFAGLIRLSPSLELEIAPKFLNFEDESSWREDFFFLSTLSKHGRLLASERLSASGGVPRDISTLVARSLTGMYESRKRRPLRTYRRMKDTDFFIDGEPDPSDLLLPGPDGFEQDILRFDRKNPWNAAIYAAARELLPEVRDPSAAAKLVRVIEDLSPQTWCGIPSRKSIPARHRAWRPLHELSVDVLNGLGMNYRHGHAHAPGYLVSTWQVWEDLLTLGAHIGFGRAAVSSQQGFVLGTRCKSAAGNKLSPLSVFPDCVINSESSHPQFLLDAKYKGHIEGGTTRVTEADVYEALAFSKASKCDRVVLAYPALPAIGLNTLGACSVFERIEIDGIRIVGIQVEVRGISQRGGLKRFSLTLAEHLAAELD
jgi:5-methylcytosine-specific restriction enzyme subunit McrC